MNGSYIILRELFQARDLIMTILFTVAAIFSVPVIMIEFSSNTWLSVVHWMVEKRTQLYGWLVISWTIIMLFNLVISWK